MHFDLAKSVYEGTLDLICPEMELLVCPGYFDVALKGTGVIRSDDRGNIYFRLVAPFTGAIHSALAQTKPAGELHVEHDHVMLRAIDQQGREWRSNWLLIHLSFPGSLTNWIVHHNLEHISSSQPRPESERSALVMYFPEQGRLMFDTATTETRKVGDREIGTGWSLDHHTRSFADAEFTFQKRDRNWLTVHVERPSTIMPDWPGLLCHALEFASARRARPAVISRSFRNRSDLGIFSGPFWQFRSLLPAPVHCAEPSDAGHYWHLVESFFNYVLRESDAVEPLLDELSGIRDGSRASVQTACLTCAIGVESLGRMLLPIPEQTPVDHDALRSLIDHVQQWDGDESVRHRAVNQLHQFKEVRAADRLYQWADSQGVPHALIDAWRRLRHPKAHGRVLSEDQQLYDGYYSVVELMYRIVTWAIGYEGPLLKTSRHGWGVEESYVDEKS